MCMKYPFVVWMLFGVVIVVWSSTAIYDRWKKDRVFAVDMVLGMFLIFGIAFTSLNAIQWLQPCY